MSKPKPNIVNRKARYEYHLDKTFVAGLQLLGSEIKSIREHDVNINDAYCYFKGNELYVKNMYIKEYDQAYKGQNHEPRRERKLLLNRSELDKIKKKLETKGYTIVALKLFINKKGWAKLEIALGKGKKLYDKKDAIQKREEEINVRRKYNINI